MLNLHCIYTFSESFQNATVNVVISMKVYYYFGAHLFICTALAFLGHHKQGISFGCLQTKLNTHLSIIKKNKNIISSLTGFELNNILRHGPICVSMFLYVLIETIKHFCKLLWIRVSSKGYKCKCFVRGREQFYAT